MSVNLYGLSITVRMDDFRLNAYMGWCQILERGNLIFLKSQCHTGLRSEPEQRRNARKESIGSPTFVPPRAWLVHSTPAIDPYRMDEFPPLSVNTVAARKAKWVDASVDPIGYHFFTTPSVWDMAGRLQCTCSARHGMYTSHLSSMFPVPPYDDVKLAGWIRR